MWATHEFVQIAGENMHACIKAVLGVVDLFALPFYLVTKLLRHACMFIPLLQKHFLFEIACDGLKDNCA